ncbi:Acetyl-CoA acetyltransferase [Stieleria maiorica]|uniref:Acetyl-CoA acetyltransferase n=1 Tax=Stieleria maiorica TaxID=2795974 RepID=A0A5B9ME92_9BACT|nr:thiolase family protein [Stieleria maiorica]QEF98839.1 Acetyl-CoA acetyltransferase [Stieleria maiorica]
MSSSRSTTQPIAVIAGARTPLSKAFTDLAAISAVDLGTHVVTDVVARAAAKSESMDISQIDELVMGNVAGPPDAANLARVIALSAGLPKERIAHTVNRNCASGMESIIAAWDSIHAGRASLVIGGGTESMSQIPMLFRRDAAKNWMRLARSKTLWQKLRALAAFRPRHFKPVAGIQLGLTDPVSGMNMGETAEVLAREFGISRSEQDEFALLSHERAAAAREKCFLSGEIAPITTERGRVVEKDNGPRDGQSLEQLARLKPLFDSAGSVTAGNSCPLTDGAAALVLSDVATAERFDRPLGYITDYCVAGCDPHRMGLGPVYATAKLLEKTGMSLRDFDLIELNEAFAAQVIACEIAAASKTFASEELGRSRPLGQLSRDVMNIHGGSIALGHPVGMTGTRLVLTLLRALAERGKRIGLATLCVGGGQGVAMIVRTQLED